MNEARTRIHYIYEHIVNEQFRKKKLILIKL